MLVPTYLAFGFLGDIKRGKYIPLAALCVGLVTLLHSVLSASERANWINMCLFYFSIASSVAYYSIVFWNIAPKSKCPEFWASIGRSIDAISVIILGLLKFSALPAIAVISLNVAVIVVLIITMAINGDFNVFTGGEDNLRSVTCDDAISILQKSYSLTPAEMRVFKELVFTEDKQSVIAERLSVKIGTIQFHTTAIYKKTGVSTRVGLSKLYNDLFNKKN